MKKIVVFGLFLVIAYFSGGYYLQFMVKQQFAKQELYSNVAASIPFEGTLEFSIPMPLYGNVNRAYEAKEGEFFYKNKYYNVLGSKIENNVLIISCIANPKTKLLHDELFSFINNNIIDNDKNNSSNKKTKPIKIFLPEYASFSKKYTHFIIEWVGEKVTNQHNYKTQPAFIAVNSPPPNQV